MSIAFYEIEKSLFNKMGEDMVIVFIENIGDYRFEF